MRTGTIFDIMKYSLHDGPGIRTTVFLKGCPLQCAWCHNPESQSFSREIMVWQDRCIGCGECQKVCPVGLITEQVSGNMLSQDTETPKCTGCGACTQACFARTREMVGYELTADQVIAEVEKDLIFYSESGGGVTFSGGEPLAQPGFLKALLEKCRAREIHTAVETTGFAATDTIMEISPLVDLFLYDLKLMDRDKHLHYTGVPNDRILYNLTYLARAHPNVIVRVPVIPGVNDTNEDIAQLSEFVASLKTVREVHLLPYHVIGVEKYMRLGREYRLSTEPPTAEHMEGLAAKLKGLGISIRIGG